jgi:hypothetical protein
MFKRFKKSELLILIFTILIIFYSEYTYLVLDDPQKAIFIGLWPPTLLGLLIYFNLKSKQ